MGILFDFKCTRCSHIFERIVKNDHYPTCPICDSVKVDKMISPTSFELKGVGVYSSGINNTKKRFYEI